MMSRIKGLRVTVKFLEIKVMMPITIVVTNIPAPETRVENKEML